MVILFIYLLPLLDGNKDGTQGGCLDGDDNH